MTEAQYQKRITDLADWLGLRWFHSGSSRRDSCAGFPDLVVVGPGGLVFIEVKSDRGTVRPEQTEWLDALGRHEPAHVWRPGQWVEVEATLRALAKGAA